MPPFSPGDRLLVLGAGATRGADFGPSFQRMCEPPLNADFFTQLQRISEPERRRNLVRSIIADVVELFGANFSLTMEDYFTQLEFLSRTVARSPVGAGMTTADLQAKRDRLMSGLSSVLEVSTDAAIRESGGCRLHKLLVEHLRPRDTVISFNYDCVLDHALRRDGDHKWSARYGYAIPKPSRILGADRWDPASAATSQATCHLKLHGSLNWQLPPADEPDGDVQLKLRLHTQRGTPRFTVIPPVWNKDALEQPIFHSLWISAERAIRTARHVAVVGFSFVPTDLPVESLFRVALARAGRLQTLIIANPSREARQRVRRVFSRSLEDGAVVRQYDGFEDFVSALPGAFAGPP
jgi:hypothetical protein